MEDFITFQELTEFICKICSPSQNDDEFHLILICPFYEEMRMMNSVAEVRHTEEDQRKARTTELWKQGV